MAKFYDIFLRNAFGNFRNLIKEVAYSHPMSVMLTYINSKSAAVSGDFADENFAREAIQLFTVGTEHLHPDGTPVLGEDGNPLSTYGVKDVASFARTWTGFVEPSGGRSNRIGGTDTLQIKPRDRDASPKMDLYDGFIGDGYPACVDLPEHAFLRKGFSYAYRGNSLEHLDGLKDDAGVIAYLTLQDPSSSLFEALCGPVEGECTFPSEVTLAQSLPCSGVECDMDRAPLVKIIDASGAVAYYEAIEFACSRFPFFTDGQFVKFGAPFINTMSCGDPRLAAAAPLCCSDEATDGTGTARCEYHRERVTYHTATSRCETRDQDVCQGNSAVSGWNSCHPFSQWRFSTWMGRTCSTQVQVQRDGRVSVVHAGELVDNSALNDRIEPESVADVLSIDSRSVFDVVWSDDAYPKVADGCSGSCTVVADTCLCDVEPVSSAVFTDNLRIPTVSEVRGLHIGALDPTAYDEGEYVRCTSALCDAAEVGVWSRNVSASDELVYDADTIFETSEEGAPKFFKNQDLRVMVDSNSFRNPPTIMDFEHPTLRQAELETDAVLDHLTTHASTAPFICKKIIQRLTSSNPSPRYVLNVVTAFRTGEYGGRVYSGEYGDLGAAVAAIFMDREARDSTLDLDPAAGKVREPLLKLLHAYRSLNFVPNRGQEFEMPHLDVAIGQQAYMAPSVFNFFLPDYSPAGPVGKALLYAPEAQILTTPFVIGYMNGIAELVDGGLSSCGYGFGTSAPSPSPHLAMPQSCGSDTEGRKLTSNGYLTYEYQNRAGDVVSELALLLTNGREPAAVRAYWDATQVQYVNVALQRPTEHASQWNAQSGSVQVTDGRTDEGLYHSACSGEQWVQVDLEAVVEIDSVKIYHRTDCCGNRIDGATVLISETPDFNTGVQCAAPLVYTGDPVGILSCPGTSGRYVTVRQEGQCLQVVELEVMAIRDGVIGEPVCEYVQPPAVDPNGPATCDAVTALDDDTVCAAAGCSYTPGLPSVNEVYSCLSRDDNGEETVGSGSIDLSSSDLELMWDGGEEQILAIVFPGVTIPAGALVTDARMLFDIDEVNPGASDADCSISIYGEAVANSAPLSGAAQDISSRAPTTQTVTWMPEASANAHDELLTPNIAAIVQEIVALDGWAPGNSMGILMSHISGAGVRWVEAFRELNGIDTPALQVTYYSTAGDAPICEYVQPLAVEPNGPATCDAVTALDDDTVCAAAGCSYTPAAPYQPVPSEADLLPDLIKLFTFSTEYAATNQNVLRDHPRAAIPEIPTQNRPYKAIVVIFLEGGADSFNMLIPHSGCVRDLYAEYAEIRSNIALPLSDILPMDLHEDNAQPCTTYGTHPALGKVKELWDAGEASWFANIGTLIEPTTRDDFFRGDRPPKLFGHDSQQREAQSVHAQNSGASGVLGRIVDAVSAQENPYRAKVYSMYGIQKLVQGDLAPAVIGSRGVVRFSQYDQLGLTLHEMTARQSDSIFADTYNQILQDALSNTERLGAQMAAINLLGDYSGGTGMQNIARVMALDHSVHESERDVFMIGIRTFDAHQNPPHMDINLHLGKINADLAALHTDLVALDLWDNTCIVSISDFGRTITSNGIGTDHAWGGNNFILVRTPSINDLSRRRHRRRHRHRHRHHTPFTRCTPPRASRRRRRRPKDSLPQMHHVSVARM